MNHNNISHMGDIIEIDLTKGHKAIVDAGSYEIVRGYKWYASQSRPTYVSVRASVPGGRSITLARLLLNAPDGVLVDHRDGNTMNNRVSNLRLATKSQNQFNKSAQKNSASGIKNVSWRKGDRAWRVEIATISRTLSKSFLVAKDDSNRQSQLQLAIAWRNERLVDLHGNFARI